jgi:hypothetical protein
MENEDETIKSYMTKGTRMGKPEDDLIVNTDDFRPLMKKLGYNGKNSAVFQEPASYLAKRVRAKLMKNPGENFILYAGGSGTGKTSALANIESVKNLKKDAAGILDGNLSTQSSADKVIMEAKASGKKAPVVYVYRDLIDSYIEGVVKRMKTNPAEMGRIVPNKVIAGNHKGSWDVVRNMVEDGKKDMYFIDNSLGFGKAKEMSFKEISKKINYPSVEEMTKTLNNEAKKLYDKGTINAEEYARFIE